MFRAEFRNGAWGQASVVPYGQISISPGTPALHYGHSIFEGLKAYRSANNEVLAFRPYDNWKRLNISAERMCMQPVPENLFMDGLTALLELDQDWIPEGEGASMYIRPFLFSADEFIGIRPSVDFTFMIIMSPAGQYYTAPVKVKVEQHYTRAVKGGTGFAKAGGNYGGAIYPAKLAQDKGYHQLIWTDGITHEYIEESGTMNVMFVIDGTLITPPLSDSILAGITRDSVLQLAKSWGWPVAERKISVKELRTNLEQGLVTEAFGMGTAATIASIALIGFDDKDYQLPALTGDAKSSQIRTYLDRLKRGLEKDDFGWLVKIC